MHTTEHLIDLALKEDIGSGDITTEAIINPTLEGQGIIITKEDLVVAGLDVARAVFERVDADIRFTPHCSDGDRIEHGTNVADISGRLKGLLEAERTALNFLQHLSGIATCTRRYVDLLDKRKVSLVDTRKTTPGLRVLEKYAVRMGGGANHRVGLYDGVLIKDNHIAAAGGIQAAVSRVKARISHLLKIEVEVCDLDQVKAALTAGAHVIMLDNMNPEQVRAALKLIDKRALVEVSGGINKDTILAMADTGVDLISVGALIHAARSVDLSMRIQAR